MALETKSTLTDETVEKLQDLVRINMDSHQGLLDAADAIDDDAVATVFRATATERSLFAEELKAYVEWNDESAPQEQSFAAKVHQAWMNCRAKLNGGDPHVVLIEAEYGEDQIKEAYEDALKDNPGSAMNELLQSQYAVVKKGHDRIRDLRDAYSKK
ncbi:PA2169 family four-helix-bundle protein [Fuerstiella marisgermanici]|uniref:DUF2383 domain-containing protein n=1 Tax=Fuerstiella marisgermanici TaxID=1891926 RepID=A0A1P8WJD3_9PLAN|nr:PA2169 family four-helix-bundle protein [Fuerstiella marisgermanici]APZ94165.1 hypothetical protein Fuma_03789 [Fuerstiella marisgermanici]